MEKVSKIVYNPNSEKEDNMELKNYKSSLNVFDTQRAIKFIKDEFINKLSDALSLRRVTAPLFVYPETGLNDNLNGYERPVKFDVLSLGKEVEIVQSLAKWKRYGLAKYHFPMHEGLYTDMNAIRRDEKVDFLHSIYVDQWDWEKVIEEKDRNLDYLKETVKAIYKCVKEVNEEVAKEFKIKNCSLPDDIYFISTKELESLYPHLSRKERENKICSLYKAVFLYQIGWPLDDGASHDGRAADYDDWNLNGDILLWYDMYEIAFEISSMGIRVDKNSLVKQLTHKNELNKINNEYCRWIVNDMVPLSIGGGIGQSRLCMFMLNKAHIGEVQVSVWDEKDIKELEKQNIYLL